MLILQRNDTVRFYQIIRLLEEGQGGMSAVYEASLRPEYQTAGYPPRLALKVALPEYEDRLRAEADYLSRFDHPNVVKVFRVPKTRSPAFVGRATLGDRSLAFYMAMEFLAGGTLAAQLEERRRLRLGEAVAIAANLAMALQHVHSRQVVNLDIKPENVMFRDSGRRWLRRFPPAVLCDFGIARDLRYPAFGEHALTIPYAAPEQILYGQHQPQRMGYPSDIFQWGIVVYLMLTGELPFGADLTGLVDLQREAEPMSRFRRVPQSLDNVVLKALRKNPDQRYQSIELVLQDLKQAGLVPGRQ